MNSTWFAISHPYVVALISLFNLQADFQAESIGMRDNRLLRLGSKQLLKVRAEF